MHCHTHIPSLGLGRLPSAHAALVRPQGSRSPLRSSCIRHSSVEITHETLGSSGTPAQPPGGSLAHGQGAHGPAMHAHAVPGSLASPARQQGSKAALTRQACSAGLPSSLVQHHTSAHPFQRLTAERNGRVLHTSLLPAQLEVPQHSCAMPAALLSTRPARQAARQPPQAPQWQPRCCLPQPQPQRAAAPQPQPPRQPQAPCAAAPLGTPPGLAGPPGCRRACRRRPGHPAAGRRGGEGGQVAGCLEGVEEGQLGVHRVQSRLVHGAAAGWQSCSMCLVLSAASWL